ncbi:MAG: hypothetical protein ISS57_03195 [Anaerolineales bacterium]|nr:hypothetical protein [Anaerolineales bacterium]
MPFAPNFWTTLNGSMPHTDTAEICQRIANSLDIPIWPQMPRRDFREGIYVQYAASLPRVVIDEANKKITLDTTGDLSPDLETFYERYLADDLDYFALPPNFATGFHNLLSILENTPGASGGWVKGHVIGPLTFGLTVVDQDLRPVFYHDMLTDIIIKNMALNARWQIRQLKTVRPKVIIFVDEPYLVSYGSAYFSIDRAQAISALDEIFDAIHAEEAIAGVHCCANTDWSLLLETQADILNLDAYGYIENLALYPDELRQFLDRGGVIAWGIVPNNEAIYTATPQGIADQLRAGIELICSKAAARGVTIHPEEFYSRSLITPVCGLASTTVEVADKVLSTLARTSEILRK